VNVSKVEVLVDNVTDGVASYGDPRPDVQMADPDSPLNVGFSYSLNTARYLDGPHRIYVRVTDSSGNIAIAPSVPIIFFNAASAARRESSASHATNIDKGNERCRQALDDTAALALVAIKQPRAHHAYRSSGADKNAKTGLATAERRKLEHSSCF
jgi:hypothetical protein